MTDLLELILGIFTDRFLVRPPFGDRPATGHFTGLLWQWLSINSVHRQIARADSSE